MYTSESDEDNMRIHLMFIEENRVKSFKDWVFDRCECTPKKVHCCSMYTMIVTRCPDIPAGQVPTRTRAPPLSPHPLPGLVTSRTIAPPPSLKAAGLLLP